MDVSSIQKRKQLNRGHLVFLRENLFVFRQMNQLKRENELTQRGAISALVGSILMSTCSRMEQSLALQRIWHHVIRPAIQGGFLPDIISTDMTKNGLFNNMCWGLPVVLSKWLNLGVSLLDVIAACTVNPAAIHRLPDGIGTWKEQARANLTIFRVEKHPFHLQNRMGESFDGTQMILPQVTIINGIVRWKSLSFPF